MIKLRLLERFKPWLGILLCVALAAVVAIMGQGKPGKAALPMWFLAAVMVIIFRFGSLAGILGTIFSAIIFATFLFEPFGRLAVHDSVQKDNLMWMVLLGLALSIFGRPPAKKANP